jgi:hypothetical protein
MGAIYQQTRQTQMVQSWATKTHFDIQFHHAFSSLFTLLLGSKKNQVSRSEIYHTTINHETNVTLIFLSLISIQKKEHENHDVHKGNTYRRQLIYDQTATRTTLERNINQPINFTGIVVSAAITVSLPRQHTK